MKNIIALGGSNSKKSINKVFASYAANAGLDTYIQKRYQSILSMKRENADCILCSEASCLWCQRIEGNLQVPFY